MIRKFTLLILVFICLANKAQADETVLISNTSTSLHAWTSDQDPETYFALSYNNKGKLSETYRYDKIKITFTTTSSDNLSLYLANPDGWSTYGDLTTTPSYNAESQTHEFTISSVQVLEGIQLRGILIRGNNITVTQVDLIKVDNRCDYAHVEIGDEGIVTYSTQEKYLDFRNTNIVPYYVYPSGIDGANATITLTKTNEMTPILWQYSGAILKGPKGEYDIPVYTRSGDDDYTGCPTYEGNVNQNCLKGSGDYYATVYRSNNGSDNKYRYILAKKKNDNEGTSVGFYKLATNYSRITTAKEGDTEIGTTVYYHYLAPHKAYLETDSDITPPATTRGITLDFGDGTTAIYDVFQDETSRNTTLEDNVYYTLQGTRVQNPSKGLYILNGKKVLVK